MKKKSCNPRQYSKIWITRWQIFVMVWCSIYFLADILYNKAININNVIILLVTSIPATIIPYFIKAYFETKEDVKSALMQQKYDNIYPTDDEEVIKDDEFCD